MPDQMDRYLEAAVAAAREGGAVLQQWFLKVQAKSKSHAADLVTEADVASQEVIFKLLHEAFPEHNFLGEEGLVKTTGNSNCRWVIDPLDGTTNYFHGFPYFAVSIGLEIEKKLAVGVVFDPTRNEAFTAIAGRGAYLGESRLRVSTVEHLAQAYLVASFPPGAQPGSRPIQQFLKLLPQVQSVQRTGSAAMNLAYLAAGRMDGFYSFSLKPWDMAAGVLLVQEAGGKATKQNGDPLDLEIPDLLASNGTGLHEEIQTVLGEPPA